MQPINWQTRSPAPRVAARPVRGLGGAVAHYRRSDLLPVCLHNLADVHPTWESGELVCRFVPSKDVTEKKS